MATFTVQNVADRVRSTLDRVPLSGTTVTDSSDVDDLPSRTISDAFIIEQVNEAQKMIVSQAKAIHLPSLVKSWDGSLTNFNSHQTVDRVLHGRVWRMATSNCSNQTIIDTDGNPCAFVRCRLRDVDEHVALEKAIRLASNCYPVYTWNDDVLNVYPSPQRVLIYYVDKPAELTATSDTLEIDDRFLWTVVAYVASKAFRTLREFEMGDIFGKIAERRLEPFSRRVRLGGERKILGSVIQEEEVEVE